MPPLYAGRCGPAAALPYAQRALHPIAVGAMNTIDLMNNHDVRESTIFTRSCKLTFWPWNWSHVWRTYVGYLCANFGLPRPLCSRVIHDLRDRQTSDKSIA